MSLKNGEVTEFNSALTRKFINMGESVYVNVYNLHWPNGMKIGAYHTGTVVYDKEISYGGHPLSSTGIFEMPPMDIENLGDEISFKEKLYMGRTYLSKKAVDRLLVSLGDEFRGDSYHLLQYNCNHFTAYFVKLLCNTNLPSWVNRLARLAAGLPFIELVLPTHWIRPTFMYDEFGEYDDVDENDTTGPNNIDGNETPKADSSNKHVEERQLIIANTPDDDHADGTHPEVFSFENKTTDLEIVPHSLGNGKPKLAVRINTLKR